MKKHLSGFSLVSVLVAIALMGVLAVGFSQLISYTQRGQKGVQNALDFDILKSSVKMVLDKKALCSVAFQNTTNTAVAKYSASVSDTDKVGTIVLRSAPGVTGSVVAQVGQNLGAGLSLTKIELQAITGMAADTTTTAGKTISRLKLVLEATKKQGGYGGAVLTNALNPFYLEVVTDTATSAIESCKSVADSSDSEDDTAEEDKSATQMIVPMPKVAGASWDCVDVDLETHCKNGFCHYNMLAFDKSTEDFGYTCNADLRVVPAKDLGGSSDRVGFYEERAGWSGFTGVGAQKVQLDNCSYTRSIQNYKPAGCPGQAADGAPYTNPYKFTVKVPTGNANTVNTFTISK